MAATLDLAAQLIARRSVTPDDGGCQELLAARLERSGFSCSHLPSGPQAARVSNLWALRRGRDAAGKLLVFAGHTDVVPTGPLPQWTSDPFTPTRRDGKLYGRGAADMKSSIAAMVVAAEEFVAASPSHAGGIAFLLTSDEEGPAVDGTVRVCDWLRAQGVRPDYCLVGEPTSLVRLGDVIKNGRRGTLSGRLVVRGIQGHIAYPQLAKNPIHIAAPLLAELAGVEWDPGNAHFPPTSWQVSNIHAGTGAGNVIPGEVVIDFNFRFATASTASSLQERLAAIVARHSDDHELAWTLGGEPFLTEPGTLSDALRESIASVTGAATELSTTGGTSDGRFIARICPQVIEFGPVNASIHKIDECIDVASLDALKDVYRGVLERLLA
ncbi:MAG: succinyl-diaminopimelate desuccinylase [Pseudomonadota bacterium]|nr:succinyl-diaminopimelate desuccinylase [Pseudomonadota bacterium]